MIAAQLCQPCALRARRYADGKVCLSLLGTFSSADASERWNPVSSSLFQVCS